MHALMHVHACVRACTQDKMMKFRMEILLRLSDSPVICILRDTESWVTQVIVAFPEETLEGVLGFFSHIGRE